MTWATGAKTAWNWLPSFDRNRPQPCQYARDVVGLRCRRQAARTRSSGTTAACADPGEFRIEHAGERQQVITLVLQRDAHRADASRILRLAGGELLDDEVEQRLALARAN
jgi:hypothetical protein